MEEESRPSPDQNNVQVQQYDPEHQKEESLNLTSAIWFAWGVLLNSGIGEGMYLHTLDVLFSFFPIFQH